MARPGVPVGLSTGKERGRLHNLPCLSALRSAGHPQLYPLSPQDTHPYPQTHPSKQPEAHCKSVAHTHMFTPRKHTQRFTLSSGVSA